MGPNNGLAHSYSPEQSRAKLSKEFSRPCRSKGPNVHSDDEFRGPGRRCYMTGVIAIPYEAIWRLGTALYRHSAVAKTLHTVPIHQPERGRRENEPIDESSGR
jgi:hypothetical protein